MVQAATKMMVEKKVVKGSIINMSSILAKVKVFLYKDIMLYSGTSE